MCVSRGKAVCLESWLQVPCMGSATSRKLMNRWVAQYPEDRAGDAGGGGFPWICRRAQPRGSEAEENITRSLIFMIKRCRKFHKERQSWGIRTEESATLQSPSRWPLTCCLTLRGWPNFSESPRPHYGVGVCTVSSAKKASNMLSPHPTQGHEQDKEAMGPVGEEKLLL